MPTLAEIKRKRFQVPNLTIETTDGCDVDNMTPVYDVIAPHRVPQSAPPLHPLAVFQFPPVCQPTRAIPSTILSTHFSQTSINTVSIHHSASEPQLVNLASVQEETETNTITPVQQIIGQQILTSSHVTQLSSVTQITTAQDTGGSELFQQVSSVATSCSTAVNYNSGIIGMGNETVILAVPVEPDHDPIGSGVADGIRILLCSLCCMKQPSHD